MQAASQQLFTASWLLALLALLLAALLAARRRTDQSAANSPQAASMASSDGRTAAIRQAPPQQLVAAKNNDAQLLEEILSQPGADANAANGIGQNALHVAALWGSTAALTVLLDHGADLAARNSFGITALHYAAQNARKEAVLLLLERGADPNLRAGNGMLPFEICKDDEIRALLGAPSNALHAAVAAGDAAAVTTLIAAGEDPAEVDRDGKTAVHLAVDAALASNDGTLLAAVLASPRANATKRALRTACKLGVAPLHAAAEALDAPLLATLLAAGAPPDLQTVKRGEHFSGAWVRRDGDGATTELDSADLCALHLVLDGRDGDDEESVLECIATLLAHNASIDVRDVLYRTPLHLALALAFEEGMTAPAAALLDAKADPNLGNKEWGMASSCLHEAARRGNATVVQLLLGAGAAVDAPGRDGWTPLALAARAGAVSVLAPLLAAGADPASPLPGGKSAAEVARLNKKVKAAEVLDAALARGIGGVRVA